jgi:hypothetical protein
MRPVSTDRLAVILTVAAVVLWTAVLVVLWGWAVDSSGAFAGRTLAVLLLTTAGLFALRGPLLRRAVRWIAAMHLGGLIPLAEAMSHQLGSSKEDIQKRLRLLSAAEVLAVIALIVATLWILASAALATLLGQWFLFSDPIWWVLESLALLAGAVPVALTLLAVALASVVVRTGGGRDLYAAAFRDWLWGAALGFGGFALAWWFGANLVYLVFALAGLLLFIALIATSRLELATHPRKALPPKDPLSRWTRPAIAGVFAGLGMLLWLQNRLLCDLFALGLTRRMIWLFLSLGLLGYFVDRLDRRGKLPGRLQRVGATIGIVLAVLAQLGEWLLCRSLGPVGSTLSASLGVATQVAIAALAAMLLVAHRKMFSSAGGSAGGYITAALVGLGGAVLLGGLLGAISGGWIALLVLAGLVLLGGIIAGARVVGSGRTVGWVVWGGLALCSFGGALAAGLVSATTPDRSLLVGDWLTQIGRLDRPARRFTQLGLLPNPPARVDAVTACLDHVLQQRRGQWWIVATAAADLPDSLPSRVWALGSNPQPIRSGRRIRVWPPLSFSEPNFFRYARLNFVAQIGCDYYDGVLLAPMPADHPQAWRCYNERLLHRCERLRLQAEDAGGVFLLRTQAGADHVRSALSVARTFHQVVRSGWAAVGVSRSRIDLLLMGPDGALGGAGEGDLPASLSRLAEDHYNLFVVPLETLWEPYPTVEPIRLSNPPGERLADTPTLEGLRNWLEKASKVIALERQSPR